MDPNKRWVVIGTGSNQKFIFATNKQRLHIAASQLIWRVGFTWVPEAIKQLKISAQVEHVVKASGQAVLRASEADGKAIIEEVTRRAISEAPGLDVWGVIGESEEKNEPGKQLELTRRLLEVHRPFRPSADLRFPNLPYHQICQYSGLPAQVWDTENKKLPAQARSHGVQSLWGSSSAARESLVELLRKKVSEVDADSINSAVVSAAQLNEDGVSHNGWIAVLHADGNGIGGIFTNLSKVFANDEQELITQLSTMSQLLEVKTWTIVAEAICHVQQEKAKENQGWILPILVGGDDITVVINGKYAFDFVKVLASKFDEHLGSSEVIGKLLEKVRNSLGEDVAAPTKLSLACGMVFTKPHHPFSHSVDLAEQLVKEAKTVKGEELSALDFVVLRESSLRDLKDIRQDLVVDYPENSGKKIKLWPGPIILSESSNDERSVEKIDEALGFILPGRDENKPDEGIPSSVIHALRKELVNNPGVGIDAVRARAAYVAKGLPYEKDLEDLVDKHLVVEMKEEKVSRLLAAIDLAYVQQGTEFAR